ncbi:Transcriptional regulator HosA [Cupriavidus metallidurans]|jgi:DNA-binding MarR family transcriptional regulator|nr:Transcriptional regulator HosA [Cupriavidus metallidurans]
MDWRFWAITRVTDGQKSGSSAPTPYNRAMETNLERRFGFLVADVGRLTGRRFDELSRATLDLTRAQYRALACLTHYGEINQACLADLMEVAPISAGRLLDRMEEGGWIVRRPNPADRRERMVSVTEKAEQALHAAREVGDVVTSEALNGFNAEEAEQFIGFLQRARGNLSKPALAQTQAQAQAQAQGK